MSVSLSAASGLETIDHLHAIDETPLGAVLPIPPMPLIRIQMIVGQTGYRDIRRSGDVEEALAYIGHALPKLEAVA